MIKRLLSFLVIAFLTTASALAVQPDEMLADPVLESRAREISKELRCIVCQNENIDESNAELARDLRLLVRDRLIKGDTNTETIQFVVDRYGDYVLLKPPFKATTYVLWFSPVLFLVLAGFTAWWFYRRPTSSTASPESAPPLTAEERKRLETLLRDEEQGP